VFSAIFASVVEGFILFDLIAMSRGAVSTPEEGAEIE